MPLPVPLDPYAGYPNLDAPLGTLLQSRCTPRVTEGLPQFSSVDPRIPTWANPDSDDRLARITARFLRNRTPKTLLERRFGLRLLRVVTTNLSYDDASLINEDNPAREADPGYWDPVIFYNRFRWHLGLINGTGGQLDTRYQLPTEVFIDFDVANGNKEHQFRLSLNRGCGDANTGYYFSVRDRNDASRLIAWCWTSGDCQHSVECVDQAFMNAWVPVPDLAPFVSLWGPERHNLEMAAICNGCGVDHPDGYPEIHAALLAAGMDPDNEFLGERLSRSLHMPELMANGHQCEALFALAANLDSADFETVPNVPESVLKNLNLTFVRRGLRSLFNEDILVLIASWLEPAVVYRVHLGPPRASER
ncbi:hypothetical protein BDZ88DRAFT_456252 [Geranomyces variabilis]|nr:hypothetical protein BDZ88DRAFT_456252 [Geranomyces variabilis]KAJ3131738.1 hypothetical protein HDU90_008120 [Geranomyces variabilis]